MGRRKCTPKQLAALKRGREIAHKRSKKTTKNKFEQKMNNWKKNLPVYRTQGRVIGWRVNQ